MKPSSEILTEHLKLPTQVVFIGSKLKNQENFVLLESKGNISEKLLKQHDGFYDIGVTEEGIVTSIRTGSNGVMLSGKIYCGQEFDNFVSELSAYTKIQIEDDYYIFYDSVNQIGVEALLNDTVVKTIRISCMKLN